MHTESGRRAIARHSAVGEDLEGPRQCRINRLAIFVGGLGPRPGGAERASSSFAISPCLGRGNGGG